jgi:membrane fusion protein, multidrug efflux system
LANNQYHDKIYNKFMDYQYYFCIKLRTRFLNLSFPFKLNINIFIFASLFFCGIATANAGDKNKENSTPAVLVETATARLQPFSKQITVVGTLRANQGIVIRPEVAGKIAKIYFQSGSMVAAGTSLVQLNPDEALANLQQSQADLELAQQKYARSQLLYKEKILARADFEEIATGLHRATAKVAQNQAQLDHTLIKAPFSGKLGLSSISLGDYVTAGQDLVSLEAIDPIEVEFNVSQVYLNNLAVGQNITITSDAYAGQNITGQIYAIDAKVNLSNRTVAARATVPNAEGKLLPGTFVEVQLLFTGEKTSLVIPQVAIFYDAGQTYVFKIVDYKPIKTKVILGNRDKENVVVVGGLNENDIVITAGQLNINKGSTVKFANPTK